jgi:hypothetical protein
MFRGGSIADRDRFNRGATSSKYSGFFFGLRDFCGGVGKVTPFGRIRVIIVDWFFGDFGDFGGGGVLVCIILKMLIPIRSAQLCTELEVCGVERAAHAA